MALNSATVARAPIVPTLSLEPSFGSDNDATLPSELDLA